MNKRLDADQLMHCYPVLQYFEYRHLPPELQAISRVLATTAWEMVQALPVCAETSAGLRKLLEAKDCFVRAALDLEARDE